MTLETCGYHRKGGGGGISVGRSLGTMKEAGYGVSRGDLCKYTTVKGRSMWYYFGETCGYHSRLEGYGVCRGRPVSTANRSFILI